MRCGCIIWASGPVGLPGWLALAERTEPAAFAAACRAAPAAQPCKPLKQLNKRRLGDAV